jgi:hypothetical protein
MLDVHLKSSVTRQRLRSGPAASYIDGFTAWLHRRGYRPATLDTTLGAVQIRVTREVGLTVPGRMIAPSRFQRRCGYGSREWRSSEAART